MIHSEDIFLKIENHFRSNLPFVVYRKPDSEEIKAMLQQDNELHKTSDYDKSGFVFAPFDDKEDAILIPSDSSNVIIGEISHTGRSRSESHDMGNFNKISAFTGLTEKRFHIDLVQKGIDSIKTNQLKKVVLSRHEIVDLSESDPINLFKRLLQTYRTAFVYSWYHPKVGLWLGATPETLLKVEGNRFETMALAGTQLFNGTLDSVWNDKEKEEQQMVTDYIVRSLETSVDKLNISDVKTVKAGKLLHLQTNITGTFNFQQSNFKNVLNKLHPTPAICGIPREEAKQFILENEKYNREFYTGFLGEINMSQKTLRNTCRHNIENNAYATIKKVSNLYVNLRCMQLKNDRAIIYVGGGITKDSNPASEWIETVNKTNTIKKVLT